MTKTLFLFHEAYVRDLAAQIAPKFGCLDVRGIVGSVFEARLMLDREIIELLLIGPTFTESVDRLLKRRVSGRRPTVVAINADEATIKSLVTCTGIDQVVDIARELSPTSAKLRRQAVEAGIVEPSADAVLCQESRHANRICVVDDADQAIVRLVAEGFADRDIGEMVFLSHQTIRNRVSRILGDTGARNRTHLAYIYLGLVHEGSEPFEVRIGT